MMRLKAILAMLKANLINHSRKMDLKIEKRKIQFASSKFCQREEEEEAKTILPRIAKINSEYCPTEHRLIPALRPRKTKD